MLDINAFRRFFHQPVPARFNSYLLLLSHFEMSYVVLARKYRPLKFADVVGQPHVVRTITNGLLQKRLAHAYLFSGPRGVGKTTTARLLARAVNCLNPSEGEPCGSCRICQAILESRGLDVIEIDAASNTGVDDVRGIIDNVRYAPIEGKAKVWIIDEVHMLSTQAFNALLKTLEEPPEHAYFLLATTNPQKLPSTILSRCQRFDFRRVTAGEIVAHLISILTTEGIEYQHEALDIIARKADGSIRDSLSLLDQVIAYSGGSVGREEAIEVVGDIQLNLFFRALDLVQTHSLAEALRIDDELATAGADLQDFLTGLQGHVVQLMQVKALGIDKADLPVEFREQFALTAEQFGDGDLVRILQLCATAAIDIRRDFNPRIRLQFLLARLATFERSVVIADLISRLSSGPAPAPRKAPAQNAGSGARPPATASSGRESPAPARQPAPPQVPKPDTIPMSASDDELLHRATTIWGQICDDLAREHNHRAQLIRYGGLPVSAHGKMLRINFQTQSHLDIGRSLAGPLREAISSRLGDISVELNLGPIPTAPGAQDPEDEATKLLTDRWGARPV